MLGFNLAPRSLAWFNAVIGCHCMSIHIQLERFEGPLGLLLFLIKKEEMDIFDINIHQITKQYLAYVKAMKQLDLELAGEFVSMAATLIHIKSRMLLPQYDENGEEVEVEDPRKELVQKLLEYQKFQEVSAKLNERPLLGRETFKRGFKEDIEAAEEGEIIVEENPLFSLIKAYRMSLKRMQKNVHRVATAMQSIASRILEIKDKIIVGQQVRFSEIVEKEKEEQQKLVTFLTLLELGKLGFVSLFQNETFGEIYIEGRKPIEGDVVERVEDYETSPEETAAAIMQKAEGLTIPASVFDTDEEDEPGEDMASDDEILAEEQRLEIASVPEESQPVREPEVGQE